MKRSIFFILFLFCRCSGIQHSEQDKLRQQNAKGEFIYRRSNEIVYEIPPIEPRIRDLYPWEQSYIGSIPKITKEWFRCKGTSGNAPKIEEKQQGAPAHFYDCGGTGKHSLPIQNEEEFIFPILIELLNEIQAKTGKKVIITCGHRCPQHNVYADSSSKAQVSKHMVGAEVDFYVQGLEFQPEEAVKWIMSYYKKHPKYHGKKEFEEFIRYDKTDVDVSTQPWYNKEVFIKLYKKNEGRDWDNRHPYPYVSLQVRYDRDRDEKVIYSWPKANGGFRRY
ncbi:MAG: DUF882 domain-containing protein [Simkania sp.]|nr:DUF882 domain-containing protein [Simkania sp.]